MKNWILKHLIAVAIGGALSGVAGVAIDPDHIGESLKKVGEVAAAGAAGAVIGLNIRAPKDELD